MNRLFKAFGVIAASIAILVSLSFSVFADVNSNRCVVCDWFMVSNTSDFYSGLQSSPYTTEVVDDRDNTTTVPYEGYFLLKESSSAKSFKRYGWAASFVGLETMLDFLPAFMPDRFHVIDVTVQDKTSTGYLKDYSKYFEKVFLTLSDGRSYQITPNAYYNSDTSEYKFRFVQKFTCEVKTYIEALTFYCNVPSGSEGWAKYDIYFDFNFYETDITDSSMNNLVIDHINTSTQQIVSSINGQTQEIKDALDANADQITGEIQNSTDKITGEIQDSTDQITGEIQDSTDQITNGWETDDDSSGDVDNISGDLGNAENDALGGKSDAEIKAEIDGVLSDFELPAETADNVGVVGDTFMQLLESFGAEYQSVMILSLTLGLAAFLVGRQYRAKGG